MGAVNVEILVWLSVALVGAFFISAKVNSELNDPYQQNSSYWLCMEDQTGEKLDLPRNAAANAVALHCVKHKIERKT